MSSNRRTPPSTKLGLDSRAIMVVHGRDDKIRESLFGFLRAIDLRPLEWEEMVAGTGRASPYIGDILEYAFTQRAQAVVVLLTPDDMAQLKPEFHKADDEHTDTELTGQARPNVLIEAGMGLMKYPARTILVQLGKVRPASDLFGKHIIHLNNDPQCRHALAGRLETAGCKVNTKGQDWLRAGNFDLQPQTHVVVHSNIKIHDAERIGSIVADAFLAKVGPFLEGLNMGPVSSLSPTGLIDRIDESISITDDIEKLVSDRKLDEAETSAKTRLQQRPGNTALLETLIGVLLKQDSKEKTEEALRILDEHKLNNSQPYVNVALRFWEFHEFETAIKVNETAHALAEKENNVVEINKTKSNGAYFMAETAKEEYRTTALQYAEHAYNADRGNINRLDNLGYVKIVFGTMDQILEGIKHCHQAYKMADLNAKERSLSFYNKHLSKAFVRLAELKA